MKVHVNVPLCKENITLFLKLTSVHVYNATSINLTGVLISTGRRLGPSISDASFT